MNAEDFVVVPRETIFAKPWACSIARARPLAENGNVPTL